MITRRQMVRPLLWAACAAALAMTGPAGWERGALMAADDRQGEIIHNVYFKLKDRSPEKAKALVEACKKYLAPQAGVVYFHVGTVVQDLDRAVNDRDWDVGLHVVFKDRAAHDAYQTDAQHLKFIEVGRDNWDKVRVFDSVGH